MTAVTRPFYGLLDGWYQCPRCGRVNDLLYGEPYTCNTCGYDTEEGR